MQSIWKLEIDTVLRIDDLKIVVMISITAARDGPAWLTLQRQSQFKIQDECSEK